MPFFSISSAQTVMRRSTAALILAALFACPAAGPRAARAQSAPLSYADQQRLILERQVLTAQLEDAQSKYTPESPHVAALRQQIADIDKVMRERASPAQKRKAQKQVQLDMARQKLALEAQLTEAERRYMPEHPRIIALQRQIAVCARLTTPQAIAQVVPEQLQALRWQRAVLQAELSQVEQMYTENATKPAALRHKIQDIDWQIQRLKQQEAVK